MIPTCAGPLETLDQPRFAVPDLACDCHAHIVGPTDVYPLVADRSFTPPDAPVSAYLKMLAANGIGRTVIVQPSVYGIDNRRTVSAVAEIGLERARGIVMVTADVAPAELQRLHDGGVRGVRFITTAGGGPRLDQLPGLARKIADFGWHIEMFVPPSTWPEILPTLADLPVPVVFDHMAGFKVGASVDDPSQRTVLDMVGSGRAWVKLCGYRNSAAGYPFADVGPLARRYLDIAPERCVWGSDWPHFTTEGQMPRDNELVDLLAEWAPDAALRRKILVDNPAELYAF